MSTVFKTLVKIEREIGSDLELLHLNIVGHCTDQAEDEKSKGLITRRRKLPDDRIRPWTDGQTNG